MSFFDSVPNAIFINLEDLQNNNSKFLDFLKSKYALKTAEIPVKIEKHTKAPDEKNCNRKYTTVLPNISNRDNDIELKVSGLKKNYLYKSSFNQR